MAPSVQHDIHICFRTNRGKFNALVIIEAKQGLGMRAAVTVVGVVCMCRRLRRVGELTEHEWLLDIQPHIELPSPWPCSFHAACLNVMLGNPYTSVPSERALHVVEGLFFDQDGVEPDAAMLGQSIDRCEKNNIV